MRRDPPRPRAGAYRASGKIRVHGKTRNRHGGPHASLGSPCAPPQGFFVSNAYIVARLQSLVKSPVFPLNVSDNCPSTKRPRWTKINAGGPMGLSHFRPDRAGLARASGRYLPYGSVGLSPGGLAVGQADGGQAGGPPHARRLLGRGLPHNRGGVHSTSAASRKRAGFSSIRRTICA